MRIAFVVAVFPPEPEPCSVMAGELTREWSRQGHDVHVICPVPNRPAGSWYAGFPRRLFTRFQWEGASGTRVLACPIGTQRRAWRRLLENLSFGAMSTLALLGIRRPDLVVCESWPILATLPVVALCRLRGIQVINYVQDLYPESAAAARLITPASLAYRLLLHLDRLATRLATVTLAISEKVRLRIQESRGVPGSRVRLVRNWLDLDQMQPWPDRRTWRLEVGLPEHAFVCLFAGTMGHASRVDILVQVALRLRDVPDVFVVCVGEGVLKPAMVAEAERLGLGNLRFFPFQPRDKVPVVQAAADVMLLPTGAQTGTTSIPSKLITYLAMARPVVCAVDTDSDIAELVRAADVGRWTEPESPAGIAQAILELKRLDPDERARLGANARALALERHSLASAMHAFSTLLNDLGGADANPGPRKAPSTPSSPPPQREPEQSLPH